jgi:hypothetical protein
MNENRAILRKASSILLVIALFESGTRVFVVRGKLRSAFDGDISFIRRNAVRGVDVTLWRFG